MRARMRVFLMVFVRRWACSGHAMSMCDRCDVPRGIGWRRWFRDLGRCDVHTHSSVTSLDSSGGVTGVLLCMDHKYTHLEFGDPLTPVEHSKFLLWIDISKQARSEELY